MVELPRHLMAELTGHGEQRPPRLLLPADVLIEEQWPNEFCC
jgi:hypothetical protein